MVQTRHWFLVLAVAAITSMLGCGGDDGGGGPNSVTGVDVAPNQATLEIGQTLALTATVSGGEDKSLTWYVNGIEDGNSTFGAVSHNGTVTYTAPDQVPSPSTVVVKAVSAEDSSKMDSCNVHLQFTKMFVDAVNGNDAGIGTAGVPLKTITHALDIADSGMTVLVHPGIYDQANGEEFTLHIPKGVSLVGMDWETCIIRGHQDMGSATAFWLMNDHVTLRKFTIEEGEPASLYWSYAIYLSASHALLDSIRIPDRASHSVVRCLNTEDTVIRNCHFVVVDGERLERGFEIIETNTGTVIENCTLTGFGYGMMFSGTQDALVQGCTITTSSVGIYLPHGTASNPNPDLGSDWPGGSAGGNTITDYTTCGLRNETTNTIYAKYNTWENNPPQLGVDIINDGTGAIITQ